MMRITKVDELRPQPFTVLGWAVPEIRQMVKELAACGVQFTLYEGMGQDDDGVWETPAATSSPGLLTRTLVDAVPGRGDPRGGPHGACAVRLLKG